MGKQINLKDYQESKELIDADDPLHTLSADDMIWECQCECITFYVTNNCFICAQCGLEQTMGENNG